MKNRNKLIVIGVVLAFVAGCLFNQYFRKPNTEVIEKVNVRVDTVTVEKPIAQVTKPIKTDKLPVLKDTVYSECIRVVTVHDTVFIYLDRVQKYYGKPEVYDAWVSGIDPALDSIRVYNKTVTNTIRVPEVKSKLGLFMDSRLLYHNKINYGCDAGVYWRHKSGFGIKAGYHISTDQVNSVHGPMIGVDYEFPLIRY